MEEKKLAIDSLKKAVRAGFVQYDWMKNDPDLDNIRNESEYVELMKGQ